MDELVTRGTVAVRLEELRAAGASWAARPVAARLAVVTRFRRLLARRALGVAETVGRPPVDTLGAEIMPLLEAARFLERRAGRLLAARRLGRVGRPLWLAGVEQVVLRAPLGAVLVLGPGNYPLMLPGIQVLQALVAGNAVVFKPGRGGEAAARAFAGLLREAGLPDGVLVVAEPSDEAGVRLVEAGFDLVVLTGSAATGRAVMARAAERLGACVVELSGADPVWVLPGADPGLVADCLAYGLRLNGGGTCIAPRRVLGSRTVLAEVERLLALRAAALAAVEVEARAAGALRELVAAVAARGGRVREWPGATVLADAPHDVDLLARDVFAPWLALVPVEDLEAALAEEGRARFVLGASVFGPAREAASFAARLTAGAVTVNDLIVPTADPRLPFGGARESGFGATRGAEGLLGMTRARTISVRRARSLRVHLRAVDERVLAGMVRVLYG